MNPKHKTCEGPLSFPREGTWTSYLHSQHYPHFIHETRCIIKAL